MSSVSKGKRTIPELDKPEMEWYNRPMENSFFDLNVIIGNMWFKHIH